MVTDAIVARVVVSAAAGMAAFAASGVAATLVKLVNREVGIGVPIMSGIYVGVAVYIIDAWSERKAK